MPEYLAPGVYVEETSFRAKSIEGVATSTAGFAGQCRFGPIAGAPALVTSFEEFQRQFGDAADLRAEQDRLARGLDHARARDAVGERDRSGRGRHRAGLLRSVELGDGEPGQREAADGEKRKDDSAEFHGMRI